MIRSDPLLSSNARVITLTRTIALRSLPIAQYPHITPPGVSISNNYPGANAQVVADTVAAPFEQQVNGVPGMLYVSSQCGNDGSYTLTVTFDLNVDLNTALVMVQNRVALAMPRLDECVNLIEVIGRKCEGAGAGAFRANLITIPATEEISSKRMGTVRGDSSLYTWPRPQWT
jgi:multidrug efflux pump subunit AcrB